MTFTIKPTCGRGGFTTDRSFNPEQHWAVFKDYYTEHGDNCIDTWVILYGTRAEAEEAKARLEGGQDKSWFDPASVTDFLYVDRI